MVYLMLNENDYDDLAPRCRQSLPCSPTLALGTALHTATYYSPSSVFSCCKLANLSSFHHLRQLR